MSTLFFILSVVLFIYALLNSIVVDGLAFDVLGAALLLYGEMKSDAAQERYWSKVSAEAPAHLAERKKLRYHERFPLWVARSLGSKEIMAMNQDTLEESFTRKFWAFLF